ncbi:37212_t:CDS:1, partial [Gigaspora margarita]
RTIVKKRLYNSIKEKITIVKKLSPSLPIPLKKKKSTIVKKPLPSHHNSIEEKKTIMKKLSPSLYDSIEEKENNHKKAFIILLKKRKQL